MLQLGDKVVRKHTAVGEAGDVGYVVLDTRSGRYFSFGEVGLFIWRRLDDQHELTTIAHELACNFETPVASAAEDLLHFVSELLRAGLANELSSR